jgi:hypothetical protein
MIRRLLLTMATIAILSPSLRAAELRLDGPELARMLQTAFNGTTIRLQHDGVDAAGKAVAASFLQLGPNLQGQRILFSVPEQRFSLGLAGEAIYRVNDINSNPAFVINTPKGPKQMGQTISVVAMPAAYLITIRFEDQGTEILGRSSGRMMRLRESLVPNVEINNIALTIALYPQNTLGGAIAFKPSRVTFFGDIQAQGIANLRVAGHRVDLLDQMTDYKTTLKQTIESQVSRLINQNLPQIAANVQREIVRRGSGFGVRVTEVRFEGTSVVIRGATM